MPPKQQEWEKLHEAGLQHQLMGQWEEAGRCYRQALAGRPGYAPVQLALAQLVMMRSGFAEGRDLYEARFSARDHEGGFDWRALPMPRWRGEHLAGKHLHLWVEQGFGDVIMYAGFLPWLLAQKPSRVTLSMFPKMMTLFARSFPQIDVESLQDIGSYASSPAVTELFPALLKMAESQPLPIDLEPMRQDYERLLKRGKPDYTAPMGDLMVYGLPDFIPAQRQKAYLVADSARVAEAKKRLQALGKGRLVGLSWHTANKESGQVRSIPLEQWLPLLAVPGCHFISLQHHVSSPEMEAFCAENNCRITSPGFDPVQDTEGLAALVVSMDEIITIDNSNVHLAGALGVPATLLLPKGCDFRWPVLEGGKSNLWYGCVSIERQEKTLDWQTVIRRAAEGLRQRTQPKAFVL